MSKKDWDMLHRVKEEMIYHAEKAGFEEISNQKYIKNVRIKQRVMAMNDRMKEMIKLGKSIEEIEIILLEEFPDVSKDLYEAEFKTREGQATNRLRTQIQNNIKNYQYEKKEKAKDDGR